MQTQFTLIHTMNGNKINLDRFKIVFCIRAHHENFVCFCNYHEVFVRKIMKMMIHF